MLEFTDFCTQFVAYVHIYKAYLNISLNFVTIIKTRIKTTKSNQNQNVMTVEQDKLASPDICKT